jgi:general L-amino acid transport system substrate-binding protein
MKIVRSALNKMVCLYAAVAAAVLTVAVPARGAESVDANSVLAKVKATGTLTCGVVREEEDYSRAEVHGNRAAFDFDVCKAISTAVNGKNAKTLLKPFADEPAAIQGLRDGKVQVVATATPSLTNTIGLGIAFSPVLFFDGQGFMVLKNSGIASPKDLAGKKVCFIDGTSNFDNLTAYAAREHVPVIPFPFEEDGEMEAAMYTANCAAMTSDVTRLANTRARYNVRAKDFEILPQMISQDPLAVAYLAGDKDWSAVVDATVAALIQAEYSGITAANVEQKRNETTDPAVPYYFGAKSSTGNLLHLDADWAVRVIALVGNYGEMYERDLGSGSPLQIARGHNALWDHGGVIYAPPIGR